MKIRILFTFIILFFSSCSKKDKNNSIINEISFSNDIAPIIYNNCAGCHYKGGPAPFSLTSYKDVYKRKKMIKHVINNNYMPPWPADTSYSHFLNEKKITSKEKKILFEWINSNTN